MALAPINPVEKKRKKGLLEKLSGAGSFALTLANMASKTGIFDGNSMKNLPGGGAKIGDLPNPPRFKLGGE